MLYRTQEGSFNLPGGWRDHSVNVFKPTSGANISFVITRDISPPEQGVEFYIAQQRQQFQKLTGFKPLLDAKAALDGRPAHFLEFTWKNPENQFHQMVMVVDDRGKVLNFTATIAGTVADYTRSALLKTINSFRFDASGEPA
jgi:hypothetical protein